MSSRLGFKHTSVAVCAMTSLLFSIWGQAALASQDVSREQIGAWLERNRSASAGFSRGDVLGASDLDRLRPFVPPGLVEDFDFPEFRMEISGTGDYRPRADYLEATLQHSAQTSLAEDGALQNYVAGRPFTNDRLEAAPPEQAGLMAAWNASFRWQRFGQKVDLAHTLFLQERPGSQSDFSAFPEDMISGGGHLERWVDAGWRRTYFSRLAQFADSDYRFDLPGAEKAIYKEFTEYFEPFEFRDQKLLAERWADPHEDDTLNAYLPNERKIRRLSAKEKSDTWLGSEVTFDDFNGFDGHVLDNTWRYLGRNRLLVVMNTKHPYAKFHGPHSRVAKDRWELREAIVVEGVPTLEGHPYGSRIMFFDAQNYQYICGLYFDRQGKLMRGTLPIYSWSEDTQDHPEESRGGHVSMYKGYAFINLQTGNSTLTNIVEQSYPDADPKKIRRIYRVDALNEGR